MTYMGVERRTGRDRRAGDMHDGDATGAFHSPGIAASSTMPADGPGIAAQTAAGARSSGISESAREYDARMAAMRNELMHRPTASVVWPGLLTGFGIGGLINGIVLRDLLQWHQVLSNSEPMTGDGLVMNLRAGGIVNAACLLIAGIGLLWLWNAASMRRHDHWRGSGRQMLGMFLIGWAVYTIAFVLVASVLFEMHAVNETAPAGEQVTWNLGLIGVGVVVGIIGILFAVSRRDRIVRLAPDAWQDDAMP